jgi:ribosomal-protein-alanine N-acetyltransferase
MTHDQANITLASPAPYFEDLVAPRLDLIPVTVESLLCQRAGGEEMRAKLAAILNAAVPDAWPHENWEPHVFDYLLNLIEADAEAIGWCRYLVLRDESSYGRTLIGSFGSGFPKPETGEAEIGYGLLPEWQRQGLAVEAVEAMLPWLRTRREIRAFVAQTFPHLRGSIRVLEKSGFFPAGAGFEEGTILFRKNCERMDDPGGRSAFTPQTPSADNES